MASESRYVGGSNDEQRERNDDDSKQILTYSTTYIKKDFLKLRIY